MKGFNWKILNVIWEAKELKWGNKQAEQIKYQGHQSRYRYLVQLSIQLKPQVQEDQSQVWKGWRLT